ncbi:MAG: zinc finger domain-containing protein [Candidatus Diapherotrites archaeon]|nr:zinc finger domain-containing protein [Candidatus Diapherotrites archaeon]
MKKCGTCNVSVTNDYVEFKCPNCLKATIIRCDGCRKKGKLYKCRECGFVGP